jgi:large subunit ribosomal protein L6
MSRIGKIPVPVPAGVKIAVNDRTVGVEGPKGKLEQMLPAMVAVKFDEPGKRIVVSRNGETRQHKAMHGLARALVRNMIEGVTKGYEKKLEVVGVGYVAAVQKNELQLRVGFANELKVPIPSNLKVTCPDQTHVLIQGADKQAVGQFAAEVRALRKPEPYKGKGIRYDGEQVRRKAGKAVTK